MNRNVKQLVTAHRQREGAGFVVRRPVPTMGLELVDPFLLIDELGPVTYGPGEAVGAPDHPHRGFETVSYILEGAVEHEDSAGHRGVINAGDVQWMTAGGGIIHSEMPPRELLEKGGRVHGFQIWVNLPRKLKLTTPRYQELPAAKIPEAKTADALARAKIIAGAALGVNAAIETHTPIVFQDWTLEPGADVTIDISKDQQVLAYVFEGAIEIEGREVRDGQMAILGDGDAVRLRGGAQRGRLLLLAGVPHREPVARYGPFVMTSERELIEAVHDYQSGRMGEITRTARVG
ncbi:MAG TPA: pirin family protein [Kofleriaceae bacterium]|nr:pirin family protein [Kofleriaceae bacterium]